jgi:hypothetical protein
MLSFAEHIERSSMPTFCVPHREEWECKDDQEWFANSYRRLLCNGNGIYTLMSHIAVYKRMDNQNRGKSERLYTYSTWQTSGLGR